MSSLEVWCFIVLFVIYILAPLSLIIGLTFAAFGYTWLAAACLIPLAIGLTAFGYTRGK